MKRKLTDAVIRSINPLDERKIYSADYPGLELWVNPGGTKSWYKQYRVKGKKSPERFRLGNYPQITIRDAELRAKKINLVAQRPRGFFIPGARHAISNNRWKRI